MLKIIADVIHPEREDVLRWLGGAYDPASFSASDVTFDDPIARWRKAFLD